MCEICGIVTTKDDVPRGKVNAMLQAMRHRGPDAIGTWCGDGVCLGNCRLAIIGLGKSGNQPMTNEDGMWAIFVFQLWCEEALAR